ncbi:hypothetical protein [Aliikangiella coralliicola]|uniref:Uncharacterized protein n=1 Tax=Aliikangiella coralliicola TaxID=2592383 RepID=A0A545UD95_9GAMM|nr:hypothetical protein [Aliikangiella coralliicola]TQV87439.1 hypothetical protein FLL46_13425 [Aliikangiella coralliicola]
MESAYRPLFTVKFFHEFYKNQLGEYTHLDEDISIVPTEKCRREMAKQGLLFRSTSGGFTVLYTAYKEDNVEKPLVPLTDPRQFSFQLFSKSPYIIHYSSLPLDGKKPGIYYLNNLQNNTQEIDGEDELLLVEDTVEPYLSSQDEFMLRPAHFSYGFKKAADTATLSIEDRKGNAIYSKLLNKLDDGEVAAEKNFSANLDLTPFGTGLFIAKVDGVEQQKFYLDGTLIAQKPFGLIDIFYHSDVPATYQFADAQGNVSAKTYTVRIDCRETIWKYLVGLKYRKDLDPTDLEVVSNIVSATFTRQNSYKLADNTTVIPFDSGNTTIPLKKEPIKGIKLKRTIAGQGGGGGGGNTSTEETSLPNPEITNIKTDNGKIYSEVYIYL